MMPFLVSICLFSFVCFGFGCVLGSGISFVLPPKQGSGWHIAAAPTSTQYLFIYLLHNTERFLVPGPMLLLALLSALV